MITGFEIKPPEYKEKIESIFKMASKNKPAACVTLEALIDEVKALLKMNNNQDR